MRDRLSTKILSNGATRYGVYDETENLLRYEYIKLEDEPTVEGDLFSKANMLPDSIPALLGLKMANPQVKDALNVLANIGNLHVWERVQMYSEPVPEVPAGYTLGPVETDVQLFTATSSKDSNRFCNAYYSKKLAVSNDGTVALANESTASMYANTSGDNSRFAGAFVKLFGSSYSDSFIDYLFYIPEDSVLTAEQATGPSNWRLTASKLQRVTGYPYTPAIPAGTTTDYLTSTNRNAYPDQSAEGGQDAYYTLGDVVENAFFTSIYGGTTYKGFGVNYNDSVMINENGGVALSNPSSVSCEFYALDELQSIKGKFWQVVNISGYTSDILIPEVVFVPSDATISSGSIGGSNVGLLISKYQPVHGHAAISPNTTITYMGQLGGRARIEVGSYVGTGTYGKSNPNSLTFGFAPKIVKLLFRTRTNVGRGDLKYEDLTGEGFSKSQNFMVADRLIAEYAQGEGFGYNHYSSYGKKSPDGKTFYWYSTDAAYQCNSSGYVYYYIAIG